MGNFETVSITLLLALKDRMSSINPITATPVAPTIKTGIMYPEADRENRIRDCFKVRVNLQNGVK